MTQETSFTFTTPLNVNVVEIKGEEHLFVEGDISTTDIDLVNDSMTYNCQKSMQRQIMERVFKLDLEHEAFKGDTHEEKEINKTKIPAGKIIDATVKDLGDDRYSTNIKGEINRHHADYKSIKGNLLEKYLDAFSVAFLATDVTYGQKDGQEVRFLNDVKLLNIALTGNPCNTKATMADVFTKSMDAVEEYKRLKSLDPSIENALIVKSKEGKKENPLGYVWDKIAYGEDLDKKELKLIKAAIEVTDNKGTEATLTNEYYNKLLSDEKLSWKEYNTFRGLVEIDYAQKNDTQSIKSNSISHKGDSQLNTKKNSKKMTESDVEKKAREAAEAEAQVKSNEANETMLKDMNAEVKSMKEANEVALKDRTEIKESLAKVSETLKEVVEAMKKPIHKSPGVEKTDAEKKANMEGKTVDPLELCN